MNDQQVIREAFAPCKSGTLRGTSHEPTRQLILWPLSGYTYQVLTRLKCQWAVSLWLWLTWRRSVDQCDVTRTCSQGIVGYRTAVYCDCGQTETVVPGAEWYVRQFGERLTARQNVTHRCTHWIHTSLSHCHSHISHVLARFCANVGINITGGSDRTGLLYVCSFNYIHAYTKMTCYVLNSTNSTHLHFYRPVSQTRFTTALPTDVRV